MADLVLFCVVMLGLVFALSAIVAAADALCRWIAGKLLRRY